MNEDSKAKIIEILNSKGATAPCSRCGNATLTLVDGYMMPTVQDGVDGFQIGGARVPCVATACKRCGHMDLHAMGVLGLLNLD